MQSNPQTASRARLPSRQDLHRVDGRLYRIVGEAMVEGVRCNVLAPIGRGAMRAVPIEEVEQAAAAEEQDVAGCVATSNERATQGGNERANAPDTKHAKRRGTRLQAWWSQRGSAPGSVGWSWYVALAAVLGALDALLN